MRSQPKLERTALPSSLFSTEGLPPSKRFSAWRQSIGVLLDTQPPPNASAHIFSASVQSYLLEDLMLSRCTAGAQKFNRSPARIARDSIDHYMIQLFISGDVEDLRLAPDVKAGGLIAFDLADVMDTFNSDFDLFSVMVPRRRLAPLLTHPDSLQGARVDPQTGPGRLLASYLTTLFSIAPTLSVADGSFAARSLIEVIALSFNGAAIKDGDAPEFLQPAEVLRVQNFIKERLTRADLDPDFVAAGVGMSRARLYRLFAPIGGVSEFIREQRLRRSLADLLSTQHAHRQIADIAYGWGFRDPVSFTRAFKQRFGRTPSEARAALATSHRPYGAAVDERVGDRLYEDWIVNLA